MCHRGLAGCVSSIHFLVDGCASSVFGASSFMSCVGSTLSLWFILLKGVRLTIHGVLGGFISEISVNSRPFNRGNMTVKWDRPFDKDRQD
jgi:hypothetical protein